MMCEPLPGKETGAVYLFPPEPYYLCFKITDGKWGLRYEPVSCRPLTKEETAYFQRLTRTLTAIPATDADVSIWHMVSAQQRKG